MPMRMILAPNALSQGKGSAKRRRGIEPEIIAGDRAAEIVDHDRQPRSRCHSIFPQEKDIELRVVGLPDTVWLRRLATVNKIEVFTVALIALVSENKETFRQVTDDAIDSPVARRAFTRRSCKLFDLTVYRSDWKGGSLKRQTFDCGLELRRNGAPRSLSWRFLRTRATSPNLRY